MNDIGGAVLALLEFVLLVCVLDSLIYNSEIGAGHIFVDGLYHTVIVFFVSFHKRSTPFTLQKGLHGFALVQICLGAAVLQLNGYLC